MPKTECTATAAKLGNSVPDSIVFQPNIEAQEHTITGLDLQCRRNTGFSEYFPEGRIESSFRIK